RHHSGLGGDFRTGCRSWRAYSDLQCPSRRSAGISWRSSLRKIELDLAAFFKAEFAEHHDVASRSEATLSDTFAAIVHACVKSVRNGGKILFFGNGGRAADAQHLATELTIRYKRNRPAIAAIALTTDTSALTAAGNDLGFEQIFARQIEALGKPGDV